MQRIPTSIHHILIELDNVFLIAVKGLKEHENYDTNLVIFDKMEIFEVILMIN